MNRLSCAGARRLLSAFHDGELPVEEQVAVGGHVRSCAACGSEASGIGDLGELLREGAARRAARQAVVLEDLQADIMSRLSAERQVSVLSQVSLAFQDMRLGFAALGSTVATVVSILLMFGILRLAPLSERPDSLAGMMETLGAPSVGMDNRILLPRVTGDDTVSHEVFSEEDAVLALSAVVTRNGRIANLEYLSEQSAGADRVRVERMLDELSRKRFEPARMGGAPVAVKTVFLLAHTTVRGKMPITPKQSALPRGPQQLLG